MKVEELKPLRNDRCLTVAELKRYVADWPEVDCYGEPTTVWIETGEMSSGPCVGVIPLNCRINDDTRQWASNLLFTYIRE